MLAKMKAKLMQGEDFRSAYEAELRKERLQELLAEWRNNAGLKRSVVAARMGIAPSTLSRMKKNITSGIYENLSKYARACGVDSATLFLTESVRLQISFLLRKLSGRLFYSISQTHHASCL